MGDMQFSVSDSMISEFFSGLFAVFALIAVGGLIALILGGMARRFPFSRLASRVYAAAPQTGGERKGEGSVLGGIGDLLGGD